MWFDIIKRYYGMGFYSDEQMAVFVKARYITDVQYNEITGIVYAV